MNISLPHTHTRATTTRQVREVGSALHGSRTDVSCQDGEIPLSTFTRHGERESASVRNESRVRTPSSGRDALDSREAPSPCEPRSPVALPAGDSHRTLLDNLPSGLLLQRLSQARTTAMKQAGQISPPRCYYYLGIPADFVLFDLRCVRLTQTSSGGVRMVKKVAANLCVPRTLSMCDSRFVGGWRKFSLRKLLFRRLIFVEGAWTADWCVCVCVCVCVCLVCPTSARAGGSPAQQNKATQPP
jgi:hypothetical protein